VAKPKRPKLTRDSRSNRAAPKSLAYEALSAFNQHFEQALQHLNRLRELGLFGIRFRRESLEACQATFEETRAWVNFEAVEALHECEERDRARFGRIRYQREKKFEDPQDVLIKVERLKGKPAVKKRGRS
jgi:HPt (histidine-containing phosphotransfer) domain-containing protein